MQTIEVKGAHEHNLQSVDVDISKHKLVAFTGVSGSGKSSLVFDTLYVEAFRRFADASHAPVQLMGHSFWSRTVRPKFKAIRGLPPALGLSQRQGVAGKLSTVGTISGVSDLLRVYFAAFGDVHCRHCDVPLRATPFRELMSKIAHGFEGQKITIVAPIVERRKGAFSTEIEKFRQLGFSKIRVNGQSYSLQDEDLKIFIDAKKLNTIEVLVDAVQVMPERMARLERAVGQALEYGKGVVKIEFKTEVQKFNTKSACPQCGESAPRLDPRYFSHSSLAQCETCAGTGSQDEDLPADIYPCKKCAGSRLDPGRPIVRVQGQNFEHLHQAPLVELLNHLKTSFIQDAGSERAKNQVLSEALRLVETMCQLGLEHLTLNRDGGSLSPGDLQRLRLASMISNQLRGALYIMDEPCQGLTGAEVARLVKVLRSLVDAGSSVVVVEHHPQFLKHCDEIFLMGPGAGRLGGRITSHFLGEDQIAQMLLKKEAQLFEATTSTESLKVSSSVVLDAARRRRKADATAPTERQPAALILENVKVRTACAQRIAIPQASLTLIRGEAGRGKSSFLELCVRPALEKLMDLSKLTAQNLEFCRAVPDGPLQIISLHDVRPGSLVRTSRRTVAAALDVLVPMREIFAQLPQSQLLGLTPSHFSWNSKAGRCEVCEGRGYIEIPQRFGPPVEINCEECLGTKLSQRSLVPRFKGLNLAEIMNLSLEEARQFFAHVRLIESRLAAALEFGLGYITLGQGMDSLSGGELQRLTLTLELRRSQLEGAWFMLLHPGTGLHTPDIATLGRLLRMMVSRGASFVVLENREEFLRFADQVVEF
jgi:excinuclease ABC subunit A